MSIQCFFDDSGKESQRDHRHVVIAGYMAHDQFWWGFIQRWKHLLHRHELPMLHLREFHREAEKREWDHVKRTAVLGEFVEAIRESKLIGIGVAVDADVWRKLSKERRQGLGNAQQFCFQRAMRIVTDKMDLVDDRDDVELAFDQDLEFSPSRLKLLDFIRKREPRLAKRVTSIIFASSRSHYPLQAADLLAWQTRRQLWDREEGRPPSQQWIQLFADLPTGLAEAYGEYWDEGHTRKGLAQIEANPAAIHRWMNGEPVILQNPSVNDG